ncbi:hypothetical protein BDF14DRAFT_1835402 [Spinellus fusiger]|nr:hypothetical protein BDF14DRAFT_1835402 [Spinellus fusiger]
MDPVVVVVVVAAAAIAWVGRTNGLYECIKKEDLEKRKTWDLLNNFLLHQHTTITSLYIYVLYRIPWDR